MQKRYTSVYDTIIGKVTITSDGEFIERVSFGVYEESSPCALNDRAALELEQYFKGQLKTFNLPLKPIGTPFQRQVWEALSAIPYGETRSYKQIAEAVGNSKASRAVGMANNRNPIAIIIPCHRVIGSNGKMIGYAGGLDIKECLLALEQTYKF
ncbi:cysteine methyltransferase [Sporanaerobium hydrogeniformans]|uniref:Cysteine methyltransferase n=1 Tax=Sporanaerobium hydrogeniformans TaxID=3072179 RepID=A0AC61D9C9_9FIRM|nr:methylated-DNA--[protein]-cysteine S-methyltransferase [Sporanaerobium hydrogeniformans]PHV69356.1 cysteine methyltransferase [Sporanaerobium hydrogeniformans]